MSFPKVGYKESEILSETSAAEKTRISFNAADIGIARTNDGTNFTQFTEITGVAAPTVDDGVVNKGYADEIPAKRLKTTSTDVNIFNSAAPSAGDVLKASSDTEAAWGLSAFKTPMTPVRTRKFQRQRALLHSKEAKQTMTPFYWSKIPAVPTQSPSLRMET